MKEGIVWDFHFCLDAWDDFWGLSLYYFYLLCLNSNTYYCFRCLNCWSRPSGLTRRTRSSIASAWPSAQLSGTPTKLLMSWPLSKREMHQTYKGSRKKSYFLIGRATKRVKGRSLHVHILKKNISFFPRKKKKKCRNHLKQWAKCICL